MGAEIVEILRIGAAILWPLLAAVNMLIGWFIWSLKGRFPSAERVSKLEERMKSVEVKIENMPSTHAIWTLHGDVKALNKELEGFKETMGAANRNLDLLLQHQINMGKSR